MFFLQLIHCQKKDNIMESLPKYNVQVCHPQSGYRINLVSDKIKTLEGVHATLPYGGSSGRWGDSGKGWTEQYGTPHIMQGLTLWGIKMATTIFQEIYYLLTDL